MSAAKEGKNSVSVLNSSRRESSRNAWESEGGSQPGDASEPHSPPHQLPSQPQKPIPQMPRLKLPKEEEPPDDESDVPSHPQFWMAAATTIGAACFMLLVVALIVKYAKLSSLTIWIVFAVGTTLSFLIPCFYYMCTSHHYWCCGKFGDGIVGGLPYMFFGAGVIYFYTILGMMLQRVRGSKFEVKLVCFATIPLFMALLVPLFVFILHLQRTEVDPEKKVLQVVTKEDPRRPPRSKGRCRLTLLVFRHLFFAGIVGVCVAAYAILPIFALCWICIGLYRLGTDVHFMVPIAIVVGIIIVLVISFLLCPEVVKLPFTFMKGYFTWPMYGWGPRIGYYIPRYDNNYTVDRRLAEHNDLVNLGNRQAQNGQEEESKRTFDQVRASKQNMEQMGIMTVPEQQQS